MGPTGPDCRVLQIHPTRRCNLRCRHCYSSSAPDEDETLSPQLLFSALDDAADEGYNVAGFSGGEPLVYEPLRPVLEHARRCGMATTVTTNGMLLDERRLGVLQGTTSLLAISLDGVPESHNRIRGSSRAFEVMESRLEGVRRSGIPFGFIFTLTQFNVDELRWVAEYALSQGAQLLQVHPLEAAGRAIEEMPGAQPDVREAAFAYLEASRIQELAGDRLRIQLDVADRKRLSEEPARGFAEPGAANDDGQPFATILSPLVIESDGHVVPIQHGFPRRYALGNLDSAGLSDLMRAWRHETHAAFRRLCRRLLAEVDPQSGLPFFNWYEELARLAAADELAARSAS